MTHKLLGALVGAALLSGCVANNELYQWGDYEETLFVYFHEPDVRDEMLTNYYAFINTAATTTNKKQLAPGLFAEAGTFMLEAGDIDAAIRFYQLEADRWPESRHLMNTLITNLRAQTERQQGAADEK